MSCTTRRTAVWGEVAHGGMRVQREKRLIARVDDGLVADEPIGREIVGDALVQRHRVQRVGKVVPLLHHHRHRLVGRHQEVLHLLHPQRRAQRDELNRVRAAGPQGRQHFVSHHRTQAVRHDGDLRRRRLQGMVESLLDALARIGIEEIGRRIADQGLEKAPRQGPAPAAWQWQYPLAWAGSGGFSHAGTQQQRLHQFACTGLLRVNARVAQHSLDIQAGRRTGAHAGRARPCRPNRVHDIGPIRHAAALTHVAAEQRQVPFELELSAGHVPADAMHVDHGGRRFRQGCCCTCSLRRTCRRTARRLGRRP